MSGSQAAADATSWRDLKEAVYLCTSTPHRPANMRFYLAHNNMPSQCLPNRLIGKFLYDIVSRVPMDMQVAISNTNVCYVELDVLFGDLISCLMHPTRVFTVLMVAGFTIRGTEKIFHGEYCDGKRRRRC